MRRKGAEDSFGKNNPVVVRTDFPIDPDPNTVRIVRTLTDGETLETHAARHDLGFHPPSAGRTPMQKIQDEILDKAKVCSVSQHHKYGFATECDGDKTLREFFAENGMAA